MPKWTLQIDQAGTDMLDFQEYDKTLLRGYYLLRGNPAVRVVTRGGFIEDCLGYTLPVLAGRETCWGQWAANAHLRGRRTFIVTVFCGEVQEAAGAETFSAWLRRHYLDEGGLFWHADGTPRGERGETMDVNELDAQDLAHLVADRLPELPKAWDWRWWIVYLLELLQERLEPTAYRNLLWGLQADIARRLESGQW